MAKTPKQSLKGLGILFTMGATMAGAVIVGYWLGSWLDSKLGTFPWLTIILLLIGIASGLKTMYDSMFPREGGD